MELLVGEELLEMKASSELVKLWARRRELVGSREESSWAKEAGEVSEESRVWE